MSFAPDYAGAIVRESPNYWASRVGHEPQYVVAHGTDGQMPGCLDWLTSAQSGASVHYLVARDGQVYQLVPEQAAAWGNGIPEAPSPFLGGINPNLFTISVEHERWATNTTEVTPEQQAASTALVRDIRRRWGRLPLIPHSAISPQSRSQCPGPGFPMEAIDQNSSGNEALPQGITWGRFSGAPQRVPLTFYADASFKRPLYISAATRTTTLTFDAWRYGESVVDPSTGAPDRRWFHRLNPHGEQGWVASAWINGNPRNSSP